MIAPEIKEVVDLTLEVWDVFAFNLPRRLVVAELAPLDQVPQRAVLQRPSETIHGIYECSTKPCLACTSTSRTCTLTVQVS